MAGAELELSQRKDMRQWKDMYLCHLSFHILACSLLANGINKPLGKKKHILRDCTRKEEERKYSKTLSLTARGFYKATDSVKGGTQR